MDLKNKNNEYELELINSLVSGNKTEYLIDFAEDLYFDQVEKAVEASLDRRIILVAGPSASGKTTTAEKIRNIFIEKGHPATVISLDDFYKDRKDLPIIDGKPNPEVIEALEVDMIHRTLESILETGKAGLPVYDFIKGKRYDNQRQIDLHGSGILIMEGIHGLNPLIYHDLDPNMIFKIYVSPHSGFVYNDAELITKREARFIRRLVRDYGKRGSSAENTFYMWEEVCESEDLYIRPLASIADFKIDTIHAYEPCILKTRATDLLEKINGDSIYFSSARQIIEKFEKVDEIDIKYLPKSSLLCEFLC